MESNDTRRSEYKLLIGFKCCYKIQNSTRHYQIKSRGGSFSYVRVVGHTRSLCGTIVSFS